ncbi:DUF2244 domain-containing protein [Herbaspirillum rubrisubalbicans]|uniref:DUF2244 domain-containing protein n=1 Tax=Herbaspirillum rubrisubalbicans TaxID=80842 RepID=UPI000AFB68FB
MVSLTVALGFTLHGAWTILFFSVIELLAVGAAMLVYARHATDCEVVALESGGGSACMWGGSRTSGNDAPSRRSWNVNWPPGLAGRQHSHSYKLLGSRGNP